MKFIIKPKKAIIQNIQKKDINYIPLYKKNNKSIDLLFFFIIFYLQNKI